MINVLHLSDLHIANDSNTLEYSILKEKIVNGVKENIKSGKIDIVAVTGDIIDRGSTESFPAAKSIFEYISEELAIPMKNFYFVAGNHDADRDQNLEIIATTAITSGKNIFSTSSSFKAFKRTYLTRYDEFAKFVSSINKISDDYTAHSFDIHEITTDSGTKARLLLLNSSICTFGKDYQKTGISKYQLDNLANKCKKSEFNPDITIALLHHPLEWFVPSETDLITEYLSNKSKLNADIVLHGHIHDGKVYGAFGIDSAITYLVSGIGYDRTSTSSAKPPKQSYRMAFYSFDPAESKLSGKLLKTNKSWDFKPDTEYYSNVTNDGDFELTYGLKSNRKKNCSKKQDVLHIKIPLNYRVDLSQDTLRYLQDIIDAKYRLQSQLSSELSVTADEYGKEKKQLKLPRGKHTSHQTSQVNSLKRKHFRAFLKLVCLNTITFLFPDINPEDVRTHFRIYDKSSKRHKTFISSLDSGEDMQAIEWSNGKNLIYHSYKEGRSLINSKNDKLAYNTNGVWKDFITVPLYEYSRAQSIPKLSFGISIKGNTDKSSQILELLSFLRIEYLIQDILKPCEEIYDYKNIL